MFERAGMDAEVEVFNLFAGSILQEGLSRMERGRKVQSIVPDMRISIPEEGNLVPRLHEIKMISSSKTKYTIHREGQEAARAVDKRAGELNAEYQAKTKHMDQTYCGTPRDTIGRVKLKLGSLGRVHGIVVGAFGEASDDLHSLIHHLAVSRVRFAGPQVGRRGQVRTEEAENLDNLLTPEVFVRVGRVQPSKASLGEVGRPRTRCSGRCP